MQVLLSTLLGGSEVSGCRCMQRGSKCGGSYCEQQEDEEVGEGFHSLACCVVLLSTVATW